MTAMTPPRRKFQHLFRSENSFSPKTEVWNKNPFLTFGKPAVFQVNQSLILGGNYNNYLRPEGEQNLK